MDESLEKLSFIRESKFEDQDFFVFRNAEGKFRLIEADNYRSYKLSPGVTLTACIRGKGCAGNEIIELMHPRYENDHVYPFQIRRTANLTSNDQFIRMGIIQDQSGDEFRIRLPEEGEYTPGDIIHCRLTGQKKGRLNFILSD